MKHIIKFLSLSLLLAVVFTACKKDENKVLFEGGTPPVLTPSITGTIPLSFANKDNQAIKLTWTNPDYSFNTGPSSHNVSYLLEIDTTTTFTNPNRQSTAFSGDLTTTITQGQFNDYLLNQLQLVPGIQHTIVIRVTARIASSGTAAAPLPSNVLTYTVTPYAIPPKVTPPGTPPDYLDGHLYITGSATDIGWQCGCGESDPPTQTFTRISATVYEITVHLNGGGSYLLLPDYGSWSAKYGGIGGNNSNNVNGDDFKPNGGDLLAPAASGNYKISVDFQRGKFTVTPA